MSSNHIMNSNAAIRALEVFYVNTHSFHLWGNHEDTIILHSRVKFLPLFPVSMQSNRMRIKSITNTIKPHITIPEITMSGNSLPSTPKRQPRPYPRNESYDADADGRDPFQTPCATLPNLNSPPKLIRRSSSISKPINLESIPPFMLPEIDSSAPSLSDDDDDEEIMKANFRLQPRLNPRFSFKPEVTCYDEARPVSKRRRTFLMPSISG